MVVGERHEGCMASVGGGTPACRRLQDAHDVSHEPEAVARVPFLRLRRRLSRGESRLAGESMVQTFGVMDMEGPRPLDNRVLSINKTLGGTTQKVYQSIKVCGLHLDSPHVTPKKFVNQ